MPRIRRRFLLDPAEMGVYHCMSRCVRRAYLCGQDPLTGKNFEYRRQWIQDRMQFLAGQFGVDLLGFAVLSNHVHVVLRNRPDVVQGWSDDEVARRWWNVFPKRKDDAEYLQLLDWTGRQLRADKRGAIPADFAPILERLQVSDEGWMQLMGRFTRLFRRAAGRPQSLQREREARGCRLMQGIRHSRAIFL